MRKVYLMLLAVFGLIALGCGGSNPFSPDLSGVGGAPAGTFAVVLHNNYVGGQGKGRAVLDTNSSSNPLTPPTGGQIAEIIVEIVPQNGFTGTVNVSLGTTTASFGAGPLTSTSVVVNGSSATTSFPVSFALAKTRGGVPQTGTTDVTVTGAGQTQTATAFYSRAVL